MLHQGSEILRTTFHTLGGALGISTAFLSTMSDNGDRERGGAVGRSRRATLAAIHKEASASGGKGEEQE